MLSSDFGGLVVVNQRHTAEWVDARILHFPLHWQRVQIVLTVPRAQLCTPFCTHTADPKSSKFKYKRYEQKAVIENQSSGLITDWLNHGIKTNLLCLTRLKKFK